MGRINLWRVSLCAAFLTIVGPVAQAQPDQTAYGGPGPAATKAYEGGETCTIFRPTELAPGSPIILWGNGTGTRPVDYAGLLHHLASYGFVVAAANTPNAGTGADMLRCLDWLTAENSREGSPYQGKLDLAKVGAAGHSQGGGGALMAGADPRVKVTAPIMPGSRDPAGVATGQHGPMLLLSGTADAIAPPQLRQQPIYEALKTPAVWLSLRGAGHLVPMRDAGPYRGALTAWFLYELDGDPKAGAMFTGEACGYCTDENWILQRKGVH